MKEISFSVGFGSAVTCRRRKYEKKWNENEDRKRRCHGYTGHWTSVVPTMTWPCQGRKKRRRSSVVSGSNKPILLDRQIERERDNEERERERVWEVRFYYPNDSYPVSPWAVIAWQNNMYTWRWCHDLKWEGLWDIQMICVTPDLFDTGIFHFPHKVGHRANGGDNASERKS
jgi:hypothetical protein